jgi:hypothetical protein
VTGKWLSKPAVLWAMDEADGVPARLQSTLVAVARYADEDGCGAWPSARQVASITRKSEAQAKRDMAALARLGALLPGDPGLVKDIRADRRPNVWDLAMPRRASRRAPSGGSRRASGRTPSGGPRGASGDGTGRIPLQNGAHLDAPEEVLKTSRTARGRVGARAPRTAPRAHTQTPRHAPPCPDCGQPYTAEQLADDEFYRDAMAGYAGCVHPAE